MRRAILTSICLLLTLPFAGDSVLADSEKCHLARKDGDRTEMEPTWSGTTVGYSALLRGGKVYFGYYDVNRAMSIADLDLDTARLCVQTINSVFDGWDSHKAITMAFDKAGTLHVAGNMHGTPLVYARASKVGSASNLTIQRMIGRDEERVTYPRFSKDRDGTLLFVYRSGASGKGAWFINRFDAGEWRRVGERPMFAGTWREGKVSAYPSRFETDADGVTHVGIVWRRTGDVATNFAISYARTRDYMTWQGADGRELSMPLTPDSADTVEFVGENKGLLNNPVISIGRDFKPVIAYTKYDEDGRNALFVARHKSSGWVTNVIAKANEQTVVQGTGTSGRMPRLSSLNAVEGSVVYRFTGGAMIQKFDVETLRSIGEPQRSRAARSPGEAVPDAVEGLATSNLRKVPILDASTNARVLGTFQFVAQNPNRDRPYECTEKAPLACAPPPSPVYLVPKSP